MQRLNRTLAEKGRLHLASLTNLQLQPLPLSPTFREHYAATARQQVELEKELQEERQDQLAQLAELQTRLDRVSAQLKSASVEAAVTEDELAASERRLHQTKRTPAAPLPSQRQEATLQGCYHPKHARLLVTPGTLVLQHR
jgi:predicted transcriptional regulator